MAYAFQDDCLAEEQEEKRPSRVFRVVADHGDLMKEIIAQIENGNDTGMGHRGTAGRYDVKSEGESLVLTFTNQYSICPIARMDGKGYVEPARSLGKIPAEHHDACMDELKTELRRVLDALVFKPA